MKDTFGTETSKSHLALLFFGRWQVSFSQYSSHGAQIIAKSHPADFIGSGIELLRHVREADAYLIPGTQLSNRPSHHHQLISYTASASTAIRVTSVVSKEESKRSLESLSSFANFHWWPWWRKCGNRLDLGHAVATEGSYRSRRRRQLFIAHPAKRSRSASTPPRLLDSGDRYSKSNHGREKSGCKGFIDQMSQRTHGIPKSVKKRGQIIKMNVQFRSCGLKSFAFTSR